jgi:hypothetical protein
VSLVKLTGPVVVVLVIVFALAGITAALLVAKKSGTGTREDGVIASPVPGPSTAPTKSATAGIPTTESDEALAAEFRDIRQAAKASLATNESMRGKTSAEVHHIPTEVLASGQEMGRLAEFLEHHPGFIGEALPFYSGCATDEKIVLSVRALCAYRLGMYESKWDAPTRAAAKRIPKSVRDLAKSLDGT